MIRIYDKIHAQKRVNYSKCALRRPSAAFTAEKLNALLCCNPIGQLHRPPVASERLIFFRKKIDVDLSQNTEKKLWKVW